MGSYPHRKRFEGSYGHEFSPDRAVFGSPAGTGVLAVRDGSAT